MSNDNIKIGDNKYQEKVVQALLEDHNYAESMNDVVKPEFFTTDFLKEVVEEFFDYKKKYKAYPSYDVIEDIVMRGEHNASLKTQIKCFLEKAKTTKLNGDSYYIKDTSLDFCKRMVIKDGIEKALDALIDNRFEVIAKIVSDSVNKGLSKDTGHNYVEHADQRREVEYVEKIKLPWPLINEKLGGGPEKGCLGTIIAPTGAGKSHALCNISAHGAMKGLNVVYITLEMSEVIIGLRHDALLSGFEINNVRENHDYVQKVISEKIKGRLFIKEFPTKSASVGTIRSYLDMLKSVHDFIPDLLVIDYADLLKPTRYMNERRHNEESIYEELRGMSQELNMLTMTATQTNRSGLNLEVVTIDAIAESYAKTTVCDLIITMARTMKDKQAKTGRFLIAKSRFGDDGVVFPFLLDGSKVKITVLDSQDSVEEYQKNEEENIKKHMVDRFKQLTK